MPTTPLSSTVLSALMGEVFLAKSCEHLTKSFVLRIPLSLQRSVRTSQEKSHHARRWNLHSCLTQWWRRSPGAPGEAIESLLSRQHPSAPLCPRSCRRPRLRWKFWGGKWSTVLPLVAGMMESFQLIFLFKRPPDSLLSGVVCKIASNYLFHPQHAHVLVVEYNLAGVYCTS